MAKEQAVAEEEEEKEEEEEEEQKVSEVDARIDVTSLRHDSTHQSATNMQECAPKRIDMIRSVATSSRKMWCTALHMFTATPPAV